jgi:hypothetical protein
MIFKFSFFLTLAFVLSSQDIVIALSVPRDNSVGGENVPILTSKAYWNNFANSP